MKGSILGTKGSAGQQVATGFSNFWILDFSEFKVFTFISILQRDKGPDHAMNL